MNPAEVNLKHIERVKPSLRYDGTIPFEDWKKAAKEKLCELLGMDKIERCENAAFAIEYTKELDGYTEYRFTVQSEPGYTVPCVMRVPKKKEGKVPLIICLQGHSTGFHISLGTPIYEGDEKLISGGDRDFCVRAVQEGFAAVAIEQRNFGERRVENGHGCQLSSHAALLVGRTTIGERVHDVSTVIDALTENFDFFDKDNIMLMGNSGGGTATYYTACLDERIKVAMPSCAVCTYKASIGAMFHCACNFIPNIAMYFDMGDLAGLIAPRKLIVVNGRNDDIFPADGVEESYEIIKELYKTAGAPDNCALVTGEGGHRFYADDAWPVLHKMSGM